MMICVTVVIYIAMRRRVASLQGEEKRGEGKRREDRGEERIE
jgi:hypothetical protein